MEIGENLMNTFIAVVGIVVYGRVIYELFKNKDE